MTEEKLLGEILAASPAKRNTILSYAYFVLHGEPIFANSTDNVSYVPFENYDEVDDFLEFHQHQLGVI